MNIKYYISYKEYFVGKDGRPVTELKDAEIFKNFDRAWEKLENLKELHPTIEFKIKRIK